MNSQAGQRAFQNARLRKQQKAEADAAFARAMALHQAGHRGEAEALYRQVLANVANHVDALHMLGVCEYQNGRYDEADRLLKQALSLDPRSAPAYSNRSLVLYAMKRFDEAIACCDKAIAIKPNYPEALNSRGNSLFELKRYAEALASYDKTVAIKPDYHQAFDNRGAALFEMRRFSEALASYDKAIALKRDYAEAHSNRGVVLFELARMDEARASFDAALAINPNLIGAWIGRANIFLEMNLFADALADCNKALAIDPNSCPALTLLGTLHERQGRAEEALACYDRALAIKPDFARAISNRVFVLDFIAGAGFEEQQEARNLWWRQIGMGLLPKKPPSHDNDRDPARRLVLGYVSSDFKQHSAALAFGPVLRNHDRSAFEIVCYSCSNAEDETTRAFERIADKWRNASQWSDEALADRIRADRVDILIDLSGHSAGHRLGVFARKPAPVQVTAWGHATGTGLPTIDYLFSDPVAIPERVRPLLSEKIYDLPCLIPMEPPSRQFHSDEPPCLSIGTVTFGVFNRVNKMSDDAVALWSQILREQPQSRLLIKDHTLDDEATRALLTEKFTKRDVAADRIQFRGQTSRGEHLAAYKDVDICLDPFPVNGGISTWEALHMGVPVVTKLGNSLAGRMSGAIATSIGLNEFVTESSEGYLAVALKYAAAPERLRTLRQELPAKILASTAGDVVQYTKAVETAYRVMWDDYCRRTA